MQDAENRDLPVRQHDPDEDSLFGSPPASPLLRGRSPSPGLALPSAVDGTKNVGTIALPGSQHYSELPVNPLALSMSHGASKQSAPQPPATTRRRRKTTSTSVSTSTSSISSRAPSAAPVAKPKKKRTEKASPSPRPPPLEILLPDPSEPVPANFLRSQTALLGTAGLVAGIKPSKLTTNLHTRGTKASQPIVIDDGAKERETQKDVEPPLLGRKAASRPLQTFPTDLSNLPVPANKEVVALLARQRDFFVTLESILKLVASGAGMAPKQACFVSATPAFRQATPNPVIFSFQPPLKRRRLNRVPAGAVDWDVPYPFAQGEGPEEYRENWQRERLKQLISQLTSMIKEATRKIALRKYLKSQQAKKAANTDIDRMAMSSSPAISEQRIMNSDQVTISSPSAVDQLISSLVAATPGQALRGFTISQSSLPRSISPFTNLGFYAPAASPAPLSSEDFDNWLNILQTFPTDGLDPNQIPASPIPTDDDFGFIDSIMDFDTNAHSNSIVSTHAESSLEELLTQAGVNCTQQISSQDMIYDPTLLAMSRPQTSPTIQTPATFSAASPIPSTTSSETVESIGPATPSSAFWERSLPEVCNVDRDAEEQPILSRTNSDNLLAQDGFGDDVIQVLDYDPSKVQQNKGKGKEMVPGLPVVPSTSSALTPTSTSFSEAGLYNPQPAMTASSSSTRSTLPISKLPAKALNRADILRRVNERRKQLSDEIIRVKTQLWETTIEQGILVHMGREYNSNNNGTQ